MLQPAPTQAAGQPVPPLTRPPRCPGSPGRRRVRLGGLPADRDDPLDQRDESCRRRRSAAAIGRRCSMPGTPNVRAAPQAGRRPAKLTSRSALDQSVDGDRQADRLLPRAPWCATPPGRWPGRRSTRRTARCRHHRPRTRGRAPKIAPIGDPVAVGPGRPSGWSVAAASWRLCCRRRGRRRRKADHDRAPEELTHGVEKTSAHPRPHRRCRSA